MRRKGKPNPLTQHHDRQATDLLRNAVVAPVIVDDPYDGERIVVTRSLRDDPLGRLHVRKQIDDAQFEAGKLYRRDWERAERGPRAIDPAKEYVDGGRIPDPITEEQRQAARRLAHLSRILGLRTEHVLRRVLCGNLFPGQVAAEMGFNGPKNAERIAWLFRMGLEMLAREYGTATVA